MVSDIRYRVTGPMCSVTITGAASLLSPRTGVRVDYYRDAILPESVPASEIEHLLSVRLIEPIVPAEADISAVG